MFGQLKESILDRLEKIHLSGNDTEFKKIFEEYIKKINSNKDLKELYEVYDLFGRVEFSTEDESKEFIEESLAYLKQIKTKKFDGLKSLVGNKLIENKNSVEYKLDQLLFNEQLDLKNRAIIKTALIKQITKDDYKESFKENLESTTNNLNEKLNKLNEEQKFVLELFVENDSKKIKDYYFSLINETENIIENSIIESSDSDVTKKLVEVKRKLNSLKKEKTSISNVEKIMELKNSLIQ